MSSVAPPSSFSLPPPPVQLARTAAGEAVDRLPVGDTERAGARLRRLDRRLRHEHPLARLEGAGLEHALRCLPARHAATAIGEGYSPATDSGPSPLREISIRLRRQGDEEGEDDRHRQGSRRRCAPWSTAGVSSVCAHVPVRSSGCRGGCRGGAATRRSVAIWYPGLRKPSWTPPSQAFSPVWTLLYAQMAYSAARIARSSDPGRRRALALWWLQLGLNAARTGLLRRTPDRRRRGCHRRAPARRRRHRGRKRAHRPSGRAALRGRTWRGRPVPRRSTSRSGGGTVPRRASRRTAWAPGMEDRTLRRGNAWLAVLHAAQAAVILALSTDFSLPVTGAFMEASRECAAEAGPPL